MSEDMFSKPCDKCRSKPAVLMFRTYNNDTYGDEGLCPQCALERFSAEGGMDGLSNPEVLNSINEMRRILTDIAGHLGKVSEKSENAAIQVCSVCGHIGDEIRRIGNMGCPSCYSQFSTYVKERLEKHAYSLKFKGLVPLRYRKICFEIMELEKLTIKLNALVRTENYEQAVKVRNRISKLSGRNIIQ